MKVLRSSSKKKLEVQTEEFAEKIHLALILADILIRIQKEDEAEEEQFKAVRVNVLRASGAIISAY
jgi:hypothetical protein